MSGNPPAPSYSTLAVINKTLMAEIAFINKRLEVTHGLLLEVAKCCQDETHLSVDLVLRITDTLIDHNIIELVIDTHQLDEHACVDFA